MNIPSSSMYRAVSLAVACALMQACAINPETPSTPILPDQFRYAPAPGAAVNADAQWWTAFGDPALDDLVAMVLRDNLDVTAAHARIRAARAQIAVADTLSLPETRAGAAASREKMSRNGLLLSSAGEGTFPDTYTLSTLGLDSSWELDLFGRNDAQRRAARARHDSAEADMDAVRLSLSAEVVSIYVEHVVLARQRESVARVIALEEQRLALVQQQHAEGYAAAVEVKSATRALEDARSALPHLEAELAARRLAMGALLGLMGEMNLPQHSVLVGDSLDATAVQPVSAGLPSELLRRRPDLRQAEADFQVAVADRDIAVADQYPRFALVSSFGQESIESGSLLESASRFWGLTPQISVPVFDGGRRRAVVREREAMLQAATASYRQAVVNALSDVEQALIRHHGATQALDARMASLRSASEILDVAQQRYAHGASAKPELLEAEQNFETQAQSAFDAKRHALLCLVALYKSLGGDAQARS